MSGAALRVVVGINAAYIDCRGKTFYANNALIENPFSSDGFINDTLEHLRQNVQSGIARRDEQQIEQTLQAMTALVGVYLRIDYSSPYASKSHAKLASAYLAGSVQAVVPHNMADVLLEGQRLMGRSSQQLLGHGDPSDVVMLSEKIALVACAGCAKEDYRPVTMEGMAQFASLTIDLLRSDCHDVHFAAGRIRRDVAHVSKFFLNVPDTPPSSIHSTYLGPYYSSTSMQSLPSRLAELANAIAGAPPDNTVVKKLIRNIERWADGLYDTVRELLSQAITMRSSFTFDIIHWIAHVTEVLLAVSCAPACDHRSREELRKHARWLIATLNSVPGDKETVIFVENFQMTEILFEAAVKARNRGCSEVAKDIQQMLASWAFKGGRFQTGWDVLERGLCGLAAMAVSGGGEEISLLRTTVSSGLAGNLAPEQAVRDQTARMLLERATNLHSESRWSSPIETAVAQAERGKLRPLLEEIAFALSSSTPSA